MRAIVWAVASIWAAAAVAIAWLASLVGLVPHWAPVAVAGVAVFGVWGAGVVLGERRAF